MTLQNYWWLIIWPMIFGILAVAINVRREENVNGEYCIRWNPIAAYILAFPFVIWAGWRKHFGDTEQYRNTFLKMPSRVEEIASYMGKVDKARFFKLFELLFKCFVSKSDIVLFVFIACIQMICIVYIYRKYSTNYWLSFFFFIASTDYLLWMHNGMRQFIAATLILLCVPLISQRRYKTAVAIVLFASLIHVSALIFLPFIFVVNGKVCNLRTMVFIVSIIIAVVFADRITGFLTKAMENTAYEGDISILLSDNGTNILRVLFYSVPCIMSIVFRSYLNRENDPLINVCANLSIITVGFYLFSMFTSGVLMGAIPIYFSLSNYILIPWLLREVFNPDTAAVMEGLFVLVYIVFFYCQCGLLWGLL